MKKNILLIAALLGAMGCAKENQVQDPVQTWTVTIQAVKEIPGQDDTKALEIEGDEATTTALKSIWEDNEPVKVYLGTECIGTLTATPDGEDSHKATLSGEVVTSGLETGVSTLRLLTPRSDWDYTGQAGILLDADNSIEKKYHYTMADVLVTDVDNEHGTITTAGANFTSQQSIYRMNFRYQTPSSTKTPITAKSVTITSAAGHLVQRQAVDGTSLEEGAIEVTLGTASADPFFVALRNGDETNEEVFSFTVVDSEGVTYKGSKTIPAAFKPNGTFVSMKSATLDQRLGVALSTAEVATVW